MRIRRRRSNRMTLREAFRRGYRKARISSFGRKSLRESRIGRRRLRRRLREQYDPYSPDDADAIGEVIYNNIMSVAQYENTEGMELQEFISILREEFNENEFEESVLEAIGDWDEYREYNDGIIPDPDESAENAVTQALDDSGVIHSRNLDNGEYVLAAWYLDRLADILGDDSLRDNTYNKQFADWGLD